MPILPVDTAIQIIVGPCIDDTDFKSTETVAYDAAGINVDLLKSSDTATPTLTNLTLTTGGNNDWTELGNGYHQVEITAAQNDTEGKLQIVGVATGVLPFMSAIYDVVPVQVYNSLVKGTDALDVQVAGMDAGVVTAAAIATDAIDADAIAADAVTEIQAGLAQTGADADTLKTLSDQIDGISGGASVWELVFT